MQLISFFIGVLLAILFFLIMNSGTITTAKRKRKKRLAEHPEEKIQTTKVIVFSVMVTYHITFLLGVWVVVARDASMITMLFSFVGGVSAIALAFYCWKSKAENLLKIKKEHPDMEGTLSDFSNMASQ